MYGIVIVTALCGYLVAFPAIRKKKERVTIGGYIQLR